jgi:hypothetical protein
MRRLSSQCEGDKQEKLNLKQQVQETKDKISDLLHQQLRAILQSTLESGTKMRKAMGALGKNSSRYWSVIKDTDTQPINTLKGKYGKLAKTKQGMLDAAFDYFQDLFKAKPSTNPVETVRTSETPTLKCMQSKKVLHHIKEREIIKALKNLKNRKAGWYPQ